MSSATSIAEATESVVQSTAGVGGVAEHISGIGGAFTMSVIAFSVVFLVLGGLSGVIYGIKYIASALEKKKNEPPKGGTASVAPPSPAVVASAGGDGPLMAVLAAAVASSGIGGRIVGVALAGGSRARPLRGGMWKNAGVMESVETLTHEWR